MEVNNPLYKNVGIHVISSLFTVEKGIVKVLLIKRTNNPFKGMWSLVGGALYNNEEIETGLNREIMEKTGLENVDLYFSNFFGDVGRSPVMRMLALSYIGVVDSERVRVLKETTKTSNADWIPIDKLPNLAYDHEKLLKESLETLKKNILTTDILKSLFPNGFTIPEIQKTYEAILQEKYDRRNFRKKLLSLDLIADTKKEVIFEGKKPAKLYIFKNKK